MKKENFYVYILASKTNGTLYVGITSDLPGRTWEHKNGIKCDFTKKHDVKILVYYEHLGDPMNAIAREKKMKKWPRQWKLNLINNMNPEWNDLYETICG
jgi:putative endonuclease